MIDQPPIGDGRVRDPSPVSRAVKLLSWIGQHVNDAPDLSALCLATSVELDRFEAARAQLQSPGVCKRAGCDARLPEPTGRRGRPVEYCDTHRPRKKVEKIRGAGR